MSDDDRDKKHRPPEKKNGDTELGDDKPVGGDPDLGPEGRKYPRGEDKDKRGNPQDAAGPKK